MKYKETCLLCAHHLLLCPYTVTKPYLIVSYNRQLDRKGLRPSLAHGLPSKLIYCDAFNRFFLIFSSMISGCGKHIASPFRYSSFKALLINEINNGGVFMGILPRLPGLCSSHALHFLNTMICLKAWKRDSHLSQICKRNEGGFGSLTRFPGEKEMVFEVTLVMVEVFSSITFWSNHGPSG